VLTIVQRERQTKVGYNIVVGYLCDEWQNHLFHQLGLALAAVVKQKSSCRALKSCIPFHKACPKSILCAGTSNSYTLKHLWCKFDHSNNSYFVSIFGWIETNRMTILISLGGKSFHNLLVTWRSLFFPANSHSLSMSLFFNRSKRFQH